MIAAIRADLAASPAPIFAPRPAAASAPAGMLDHRIAEEIEAVRRSLDALGEELADDLVLLQRHAPALQRIDRITQVLGHLAQVLATDDRGAAVAQISLHDLKTRLERRPA